MALAKILLAVDGSEDAAVASQAAANLSAKTGAELHVVHARHLPAMVEPAPLPFELYEEDARKILAEELGRAAEHGARNLEGHLKRDHPVDAILDPATIAAVGARGLVRRALLGGVSTKVLRAASGPVDAPCTLIAGQGPADLRTRRVNG